MRIVSFGYLDDEPPPAHLTLDLRNLFRDPHVDPAMRQMTGRDQAVIDNVMKQPGADGDPSTGVVVLLDAQGHESVEASSALVPWTGGVS